MMVTMGTEKLTMSNMRESHDLVIDFETMGQNEAACAVIECAALYFDWSRFIDNPYSFEELVDLSVRYKLDVAAQVTKYNWKIEPDTLTFWQGTPADVQKRITPKKGDLSVEEFCDQFIDTLKAKPKVDYWWSRSNNFDPPILLRLMRAAGNYHTIRQYLPIHRVRDTRSFIDAKFNFSTRNGFVPVADEVYWTAHFKAHNSQHDTAADVLRLQAIARAEADLDQVEK